MSAAIRAVVLGATGYVGGELLRLIAGHPHFELAAAVSTSRAGEPIAATFPNLGSVFGERAFVARDAWAQGIASGEPVALFSAAPHGASAALIADTLTLAADRELDVHVVDCSADFRYADRAAYESVYGIEHGAPELLAEFVSGVPEHVGTHTARHVGHPGCFATAVLLAAVPLVDSGLTDNELFVTGITGSTGSGRSPQPGTHHPERHSNLYAYKALAHRHAPEIVACVRAATGRDASVHFVPHSGPFARGIHATLYARTKTHVSGADLLAVFEQAYKDAPFVDVVAGTPRLKNVVASNRSEIGIATDSDSVVVMSAIDNLVKGAAGGAVQWMNRLWQLPETAGLTAAPPAWT